MRPRRAPPRLALAAAALLVLVSRAGDNPMYVEPSQVVAVFRSPNGGGCDTEVLTLAGPLWTCLSVEEVRRRLESS